MDNTEIFKMNSVKYSEVEMRTIACRVLGLERKQISKCLCRGINTVKHDLKQIYGRMEVCNISQLLAHVLTHGFDPKGYFKGRPLLSPDEYAQAEALLAEAKKKKNK